MCLTGSITYENKGGGSDPLRKIFITNPFFFVNASLTDVEVGGGDYATNGATNAAKIFNCCQEVYQNEKGKQLHD